jgi:hypothetical protein
MTYPKDLYESRDVDEKLQKAAVGWLSPGSKLRWVSLKSKPGNGNSELLRHFHDWLKAYHAGFDDIRVVTVRGDATHYPSFAGPLTRKIALLYQELQRSRWQKIKHHFRTAPLRRSAIACLMLLGCIVLACLVAATSEYNRSPEAPWTINVWRWAGGFVFTFLPANWYKLPVWLFTEYLRELVLCSGISGVIAYLASGQLRGSGRERVSKREQRELKSTHKLVKALLAISHNCRGLILLIDDAQWLPDEEKCRLVELIAPPAGATELGAFAAKRRLLVVTLESVETEWLKRPEGAAQTLDVPDFTLDALSRMAWTQLKDFGQLEEGKREALLHKAQVNVNALFEQRAEALDRQVGKLFDEAKAEGFPDGFDRKDQMAYWALSRTPSVTKSEMRNWLESLEPGGHLKEFGLRPPGDIKQLATGFAKTTLAQQEGATYFLDVARCQALQRWLRSKEGREGDGDRRLLARAHYFWFRHFRDQVSAPDLGPVAVAALTADDRQAVKEAAWHAVRIGLDLERATDALEAAAGLSADERKERCYEVAEALLCAASVYRGEGDTTEANDLIVDALEWLPEQSGERRQALLERAAGELWQNYWLSGSEASVGHLAEMLRGAHPLALSPTWKVNRRYLRLLRCRLPLPPPPEETPLPDELRNLHRLTETLCDIRLLHGMVGPALADPSVEIREPVVARGESLRESQLRYLRVAALAARRDMEGLGAALEGWRARLRGPEPYENRLGDEALRCYDRARYCHALADICRAGFARIGGDEDIPLAEKESARAELFERVRDFCLTPPPEGTPLPEHLWQEARASYTKARQLATFLYWQPLVMEVCFREGELLRQHTPEGLRRPSARGKPWWRHWDRLFWQSLRIEREFRWIANAPTMHRLRWEFFSEREDTERSVVDAYNALQTSKRAKYPLRLILSWHKQVSVQLTNHSDSDEDRRRDAELHEEWADSLASRDEARGYWSYDTLELERASSLLFAAQARRLRRELDRAEKLLDRAASLVEAAPPVGEEDGAEGGEDGGASKKLRDLKISLRIQRAWLLSAQERKDDYRRSIRAAWSDIRREDEDSAILLTSLVSIEHEEKLLGDPWPPPGVEPREDPDSPALSLPAGWFGGESGLRLKNRFEFRFYQLLSLVNYVERIEHFGAKVGVEHLPSMLGFLDLAVRRARTGFGPGAAAAGPELLFRPDMLRTMAQLDWLGTNKFADAGMSFAEYGRLYNHTAATRALIINLLEAVRFYFAEVEKVDREELDALRLLMEFEPDSPKNYRLEYVRVLCQQKEMRWHEELSLDAAPKDWYDAAQEMHKYLYVLVDDGLWSSSIRMELQRRGVSEKEFEEQRASRAAALRAAFGKYEAGDGAACLAALQPHLPRESPPWVFMEDLKMLNLWLRCTPQGGEAALEAQRRAAQLRTLARQYIRQFGVVVKEAEVQRLVSGIVGGLQSAVD